QNFAQTIPPLHHDSVKFRESAPSAFFVISLLHFSSLLELTFQLIRMFPVRSNNNVQLPRNPCQLSRSGIRHHIDRQILSSALHRPDVAERERPFLPAQSPIHNFHCHIGP